jgi:hypothetical protein
MPNTFNPKVRKEKIAKNAKKYKKQGLNPLRPLRYLCVPCGFAFAFFTILDSFLRCYLFGLAV